MRVPLSAIIAGVEMLADELRDHADPAVGALLTRTSRAAYRLSRMLDQHMEFGAVLDAPTAREVDLGQVVEQLRLDAAAILEPAGATIEVGELPVDARGPGRHVLRAAQPRHQLGEVRPAGHSPRGAHRLPSGRSRLAHLGERQRGRHPGAPPARRVLALQPGRRRGLGLRHRVWPRWPASSLPTEVGSAPRRLPGGGTEIWFEVPDELPVAAVGRVGPPADREDPGSAASGTGTSRACRRSAAPTRSLAAPGVSGLRDLAYGRAPDSLTAHRRRLPERNWMPSAPGTSAMRRPVGVTSSPQARLDRARKSRPEAMVAPCT